MQHAGVAFRIADALHGASEGPRLRTARVVELTPDLAVVRRRELPLLACSVDMEGIRIARLAPR